MRPPAARATLPLMPRYPRQGLTTLAALAAILLLAALTATLQTRAAADLRLIVRLTQDLETQVAKDAILDRLRPLIAEAMAGSPDALLELDGTPLVLTQADRDWLVSVQDVEGLIDLYLAPPDLLALLNIPDAARSAAMGALAPGERFPTLIMSLARFGIDPTAVAGMVTQSGTTGALRKATLAEPLRPLAANTPPGPHETEQITRVVITVGPLTAQ